LKERFSLTDSERALIRAFDVSFAHAAVMPHTNSSISLAPVTTGNFLCGSDVVAWPDFKCRLHLKKN